MSKDMLQNILNALHLAKDTAQLYPDFPPGMKTSHFHILYSLYNLGKDVKISDISNDMLITLPNITVLVKELEKMGLLIKKPSPDDRRVTLVELTDEGLKILTNHYLNYRKRLEEKLNPANFSKYETMIEGIEELNKMFQSAADEINLKNQK